MTDLMKVLKAQAAAVIARQEAEDAREQWQKMVERANEMTKAAKALQEKFNGWCEGEVERLTREELEK